jgi:hypothetical protein
VAVGDRAASGLTRRPCRAPPTPTRRGEQRRGAVRAELARPEHSASTVPATISIVPGTVSTVPGGVATASSATASHRMPASRVAFGVLILLPALEEPRRPSNVAGRASPRGRRVPPVSVTVGWVIAGIRGDPSPDGTEETTTAALRDGDGRGPGRSGQTTGCVASLARTVTAVGTPRAPDGVARVAPGSRPWLPPLRG